MSGGTDRCGSFAYRAARHGDCAVSTKESYKRKAGQGLYRAEISEIGARYARVLYRPKGEFDVSEQQYRAEGHKPDFDELPSREEYDTANRPRAKYARRT
jgi:hypothetical protein